MDRRLLLLLPCDVIELGMNGRRGVEDKRRMVFGDAVCLHCEKGAGGGRAFTRIAPLHLI